MPKLTGKENSGQHPSDTGNGKSEKLRYGGLQIPVVGGCMPSPPMDWLDRLFRESGKSKRELAEKLDLKPSAISKLLSGNRQFKVRELNPVAEFFGLTRDQLNEIMGEGGRQPILPVRIEQRPLTLPLHAVNQLDASCFEMLDSTRQISRPVELNDVKGAFAVYVAVDHMSPALERGDIAIIDPSRPAAPGDDVLLIHQDGVRKTFRRLLGKTGASWKVEQFSPRATASLPLKDWPTALRIFGIRRR